MYSIARTPGSEAAEEVQEAMAFLKGIFGDEEFSANDAREAMVDAEITQDPMRASNMVSRLVQEGYLE